METHQFDTDLAFANPSSPRFFKLYDKEKILAFDQASKVEEWDNGIVHVHLYEGIFDGVKRGNQKRQQAFRDLLEIEKRKIK